MFMGTLPAAAVADKGVVEFIPQAHPFDANDSDDGVAFLMGLTNWFDEGGYIYPEI